MIRSFKSVLVFISFLLIVFVAQLAYLDYALEKKLAVMEAEQCRNVRIYEDVQNSARLVRLHFWNTLPADELMLAGNDLKQLPPQQFIQHLPGPENSRFNGTQR